MARGLGEFQEEQRHSARNAEILALVDQKDPPLNYEMIGRRFGLTKQRVGQIVKQERRRAQQPS